MVCVANVNVRDSLYDDDKPSLCIHNSVLLGLLVAGLVLTHSFRRHRSTKGNRLWPQFLLFILQWVQWSALHFTYMHTSIVQSNSKTVTLLIKNTNRTTRLSDRPISTPSLTKCLTTVIIITIISSAVLLRNLRSFEIDSNSILTIPIRFDLKVTGRFEILNQPYLPSYHKPRSLFNKKLQPLRRCNWDSFYVYDFYRASAYWGEGKGRGGERKGRGDPGEEGEEWEGDWFGPRSGPSTFLADLRPCEEPGESAHLCSPVNYT